MEALRTRDDMSDEENVKDAVHQLDRAGHDAEKLVAWTQRWGRLLTERCLEVRGKVFSQEQVDALDREVSDLEKDYDKIADAARDAIRGVERALQGDDVPKSVAARMEQVTEKLEAAL